MLTRPGDWGEALPTCEALGMPDHRSARADGPAADPVLRRTLASAGLPTTGRFLLRAGWVSRAWIGEHHVVRVSGVAPFRDAYRHEAQIADLLVDSGVPHARHIAHGHGPDGAWYVSERLPGRTLHEAWPAADGPLRRSMIESLGAVLRTLHSVPAQADLLPPWLAHALDGGPWPAYHPPVVDRSLQRVEEARRRHGRDARLLADVTTWVRERLPLFDGDRPALVHGDLHGSNVLVDGGRVTGLVDFAEALGQPADAELDTLLRWCARAREFPPTPYAEGLDPADLVDVPGWLGVAYPELFAREHLRERLDLYDMHMELALYAHHPEAEVRDLSRDRIAQLLQGRNHLGGLLR